MSASLHLIHAGRPPVVNPVIRGRPKGVTLLSVARRERVALALQAAGNGDRRRELINSIEQVAGGIKFAEAIVSGYATLRAQPREAMVVLHMVEARREAGDAAECLIDLRKKLAALESELRRLCTAG